MTKLLPVLLLILGIGLGVFLINQQYHLFSQADATLAPQYVRISNISDNSLTVSWLTPAKATIGYVSYGELDQLTGVGVDDRDTQSPKARFTHHVTLKKLEPGKVYRFKIVSGGQNYDNNGKLFEQKTAPSTGDPPVVADPLLGKVNKAGGGVPAESLVYAKLGDSTLLSSYTRESGNWLITLNNARNVGLDGYVSYNDNDPLTLTALGGPSSAGSKTIKLSEKTDIININLENQPTDRLSLVTTDRPPLVITDLSKPQISNLPSCANEAYNFNISWNLPNIGKGYYVDLSEDADFKTFKNKQINNGNTINTSGFGTALQPNHTYYVRVWNFDAHSPISNPLRVVKCDSTQSQQANSSSSRQTTARVNSPTKGYLDAANCDVIVGWSCDPDDFNKSIDVHIYDGPAESKKLVTSAKADAERTDLKPLTPLCNGTIKHGFEVRTPDSLKDGQDHFIYVYGINTPASPEGNYQVSESGKKLNCPAP